MHILTSRVYLVKYLTLNSAWSSPHTCSHLGSDNANIYIRHCVSSTKRNKTKETDSNGNMCSFIFKSAVLKFTDRQYRERERLQNAKSNQITAFLVMGCSSPSEAANRRSLLIFPLLLSDFGH